MAHVRGLPWLAACRDMVPMNRKLATIAPAVAFAAVAAWATGEAAMPIRIESPKFDNGGAIPTAYTCEGKDASPPLSWSGVPASARALALVVDDPDAPDPKAPKGVFVHWVVYNLPPSTNGLPEAVHRGSLPAGASEGMNDMKKTGYFGPCPPVGRHRYFFKLYALDAPLDGLKNPTKVDLERAMKGHVVGQGELVGTFEKSP
jgi:Raf kinase inhibitor-like YbhB/YbcL family protein